MSQSKILLDTNSYLRLARSIHPLLFECFGHEEHCLYVLKELDDEVSRNRRLLSKFAWVDESKFRENRGKRLPLSKQQRRQFELVEGLLWDHVVNELPGPSRIDCKALGYGKALDAPVVTDDGDMIELAGLFDITVMTTLQLLKLMLDCGHVDMPRVRQIAAYWSYEKDLPRNFAKDYKKLFGENPPV